MTFDMATVTGLAGPIFAYLTKMWWVLVYEKAIWFMGISIAIGYVAFPVSDLLIGLFLGSRVYSDPVLGGFLQR